MGVRDQVTSREANLVYAYINIYLKMVQIYPQTTNFIRNIMNIPKKCGWNAEFLPFSANERAPCSPRSRPCGGAFLRCCWLRTAVVTTAAGIGGRSTCPRRWPSIWQMWHGYAWKTSENQWKSLLQMDQVRYSWPQVFPSLKMDVALLTATAHSSNSFTVCVRRARTIPLGSPYYYFLFFPRPSTIGTSTPFRRNTWMADVYISPAVGLWEALPAWMPWPMWASEVTEFTEGWDPTNDGLRQLEMMHLISFNHFTTRWLDGIILSNILGIWEQNPSGNRCF